MSDELVWSDACCPIRYCSSEQNVFVVWSEWFSRRDMSDFESFDQNQSIRSWHVAWKLFIFFLLYKYHSFRSVAFFRNFSDSCLIHFCLHQNHYIDTSLCAFCIVIKETKIEDSSILIGLPLDHRIWKFDLIINPKLSWVFLLCFTNLIECACFYICICV